MSDTRKERWVVFYLIGLLTAAVLPSFRVAADLDLHWAWIVVARAAVLTVTTTLCELIAQRRAKR